MTAKTERAAAIRWIQAEMADYGLTLAELEAAGCFDPPPPPPPAPAPPPPPPPVVCYRNAAGQNWDGQGRRNNPTGHGITATSNAAEQNLPQIGTPKWLEAEIRQYLRSGSYDSSFAGWRGILCRRCTKSETAPADRVPIGTERTVQCEATDH